MPTKIEKDQVSGEETTGHVWDGLRELNTPLPTWWVYTFWATVVWAVMYCVLYPAWPWLSGHTSGVLGYWSRGELAAELDVQAKARSGFVNRIRDSSLEAIRKDPELMAFAMAGGRSAFQTSCMQCHGAGGAGSLGYPNLVDDDWLWGGSLEQIHESVAYGVRNANDKSRQSAMPRFGLDEILKPAEVAAVTDHVLSLSGKAPANAAGAKLYKDNCASCHGDEGKGKLDMGSPNLTDGIWLYGGDRDAVYRSIYNARAGNMPAWSERLDPATIKMLAVYVHALGGGR